MKRVLFISECRPEPGYGTGERALSICNALRKLGEVQLLIVPPPNVAYSPQPGENVVHLLDSPDMATAWYWRKRNLLFSDYRPEQRVARNVASLHQEHNFDLFFGRLQCPILGDCARLGPSFIDLDIIPTERVTSALPAVNRLRRAALCRSLAQFKCVFVPKKSDMLKISHPNIQVLPCISTQPTDASPFKVGNSHDTMLFVGGLAWPPNAEGLMRFIEKSLPIVRHRLPNTVLRIVGRLSNAHMTALRGREGVEVVGFVADLAAEYRQADVCICPIWRGEGANVKLAEYAGFGRAIVATAFSARGYEGILEPGRDLLTANSDDDLANCCVELLTDDQRRQSLAHSARTVAHRMLSQTAIDRSIQEAVDEALR